MTIKVKLEGAKELERALEQLPRATQKNVVRRVLRKAGQPIERTASAKAPVDAGDLASSIAVSTKLSKRQKRLNKRTEAAKAGDAQVFVGAGQLSQAHLQEFGTAKMDEQAFMEPAFNAHKRAVLSTIMNDLLKEINKAAERRAKKLAKAKK